MFTLCLEEEYFNSIVEGKKVVEGRVYKEKYRELSVGDHILFESGKKSVECEICGLSQFQSFDVFIDHFGVENVLPGYERNQAVAVYHSFPGYTIGEQEMGVIGIEIKVVT